MLEGSAAARAESSQLCLVRCVGSHESISRAKKLLQTLANTEAGGGGDAAPLCNGVSEAERAKAKLDSGAIGPDARIGAPGDVGEGGQSGEMGQIGEIGIGPLEAKTAVGSSGGDEFERLCTEVTAPTVEEEFERMCAEVGARVGARVTAGVGAAATEDSSLGLPTGAVVNGPDRTACATLQAAVDDEFDRLCAEAVAEAADASAVAGRSVVDSFGDVRGPGMHSAAAKGEGKCASSAQGKDAASSVDQESSWTRDFPMAESTSGGGFGMEVPQGALGTSTKRRSGVPETSEALPLEKRSRLSSSC